MNALGAVAIVPIVLAWRERAQRPVAWRPACEGLATVLVAAGLLDLSQVHQLETVLAPQVVGGLLFGVGFVTGGWCPGTALVGAASGRADALAFLAAAGLGSLGFAAAWPALSSFAREGACGVCALPETLGMPAGLVVAAVAAMALGAFVLSERLEAGARARASS